MNEQAKWWAGQAGREYHSRNRVDWTARLPFWDRIVRRTRARSVYEVGCGPAWNLWCCRRYWQGPQIYGCDVNRTAVEQARAAGIDVFHGDALSALETFQYTPTFDLVFTCGVLIHIPPEQLHALMFSIASTSAQYVLAVEYGAESDECIEILYRGERDRLWKRDYGKLYQDLGLTLIEQGEVGPADGFDNCTWWLLTK